MTEARLCCFADWRDTPPFDSLGTGGCMSHFGGGGFFSDALPKICAPSTQMHLSLFLFS